MPLCLYAALVLVFSYSHYSEVNYGPCAWLITSALTAEPTITVGSDMNITVIDALGSVLHSYNVADYINDTIKICGKITFRHPLSDPNYQA